MIEFVNIRTGERRSLERPHQIAAFLNSTDLHVNSTKGQDFGWRLEESLVARIDEMREDAELLERISKSTGVPVDELTTIHLVQEISNEQALREKVAARNSERNPAFKEQYEERIKQIKSGKAEKPAVAKAPTSEPPKTPKK